jgi:gamma-glutamylaminecyclotransferase
MTHRVFVYGSLKRGHWNHPLLRDYHAEFKGETVTEQRYHMLSGRIELSGRFPVVLDDDPAPSARPVTGEIYHVSDECLERLDRLERVPESYERKVADVTEKGYPVKAFIYVGNPERWKRSGWPLWTTLNKDGELVWTGE